MKSKLMLLLFAAALCGSTVAHAQQWSGILDPSRAIDWTLSGVPGGIPTTRANCTTTACNTLYGGTVTAATINAAIQSAPADTVVRIPSGTFTVSSCIVFTGKSNVTLRGAGPLSTKLTMGAGGCGPRNAAIVIGDQNADDWSVASTFTTWTAGYAQGTSQITVGSASAFSVGQLIILDQLQDRSDTGGAINTACKTGEDWNSCGTWHTNNDTSPTSGWSVWGRGICSGSSCSGIGVRSQIQVTRIIEKTGNVLTINPPVYATNWRSGQSPQAWRPSATIHAYNGIENLTADFRTGSSMTAVAFVASYASWLKNVRLIGRDGGTYIVMDLESLRSEVRDSYLYAAGTSVTTNYGFVPIQSSAALFINNIVHHTVGSMTSATGSGFVQAYNYGISQDTSNTWMSKHNQNHGPDYHVLSEGNDMNGHLLDNLHGASTWTADFRNRYHGYESGDTGNLTPAQPTAFRRGSSWIGNVLGTSGIQTTLLACISPSPCNTPYGGGNADATIFVVGYPNTYTDAGNTVYDPVTYTTMMRWGNYSVVKSSTDTPANSGIRFVASEVGNSTALAYMPAQPVPASTTLPASFFLSVQPSFWSTPWGTPLWPPIGPDVTCSTNCEANVDNHVSKIPARLCFENTANDGAYSLTPAVKAFDASNCYSQSGGTASLPESPSSLVVQ